MSLNWLILNWLIRDKPVSVVRWRGDPLGGHGKQMIAISSGGGFDVFCSAVGIGIHLVAVALGAWRQAAADVLVISQEQI